MQQGLVRAPAPLTDLFLRASALQQDFKPQGIMTLRQIIYREMLLSL